MFLQRLHPLSPQLPLQCHRPAPRRFPPSPSQGRTVADEVRNVAPGGRSGEQPYGLKNGGFSRENEHFMVISWGFHGIRPVILGTSATACLKMRVKNPKPRKAKSSSGSKFHCTPGFFGLKPYPMPPINQY